MKKLSNLLNNQEFKEFHKKSKGFKPFPKESFDFITLIEAWPQIVGERLAKHTIPLKNQRKVLTILTNHSAFSQQLSFMEDLLIKKIGEHFPNLKSSIKKINFQSNSQHFDQVSKIKPRLKEAPKQKIKLHPHSPEFKRLKKEAEVLLQEIDDEELKESLTSIFIQRHHMENGQ